MKVLCDGKSTVKIVDFFYALFIIKMCKKCEIAASSNLDEIFTPIKTKQVNEELISDTSDNYKDNDPEADPQVEFEPDDGLDIEFIPIEGGWTQYIKDNIQRVGSLELALMWRDQLLEEFDGISLNEVDEMIYSYMLYSLNEKTYKDLRRKAPNYLNIRQKSKANKKGSFFTELDGDVMFFRTPSFTKEGITYEQRVRLVKLPEIIKQYKGRLKPIEIARLALKADIEVHCTDPSWKYWGFQYIGSRDNYSIFPEPRFPRINNPNTKGSVCKHLDNVLLILPFQNSKLASQLKENGRL